MHCMKCMIILIAIYYMVPLDLLNHAYIIIIMHDTGIPSNAEVIRQIEGKSVVLIPAVLT